MHLHSLCQQLLNELPSMSGAFHLRKLGPPTHLSPIHTSYPSKRKIGQNHPIPKEPHLPMMHPYSLCKQLPNELSSMYGAFHLRKLGPPTHLRPTRTSYPPKLKIGQKHPIPKETHLTLLHPYSICQQLPNELSNMSGAFNMRKLSNPTHLSPPGTSPKNENRTETPYT